MLKRITRIALDGASIPTLLLAKAYHDVRVASVVYTTTRTPGKTDTTFLLDDIQQAEYKLDQARHYLTMALDIVAGNVEFPAYA